MRPLAVTHWQDASRVMVYSNIMDNNSLSDGRSIRKFPLCVNIILRKISYAVHWWNTSTSKGLMLISGDEVNTAIVKNNLP